MRIIDANNEMRWCVTAGAPTLDSEGRAIRLSGVTLDITERKQAEAALTQANVDLEQRIAERTREREAAQSQLHEMQKMESLGQLTGGIAHDFNNLLMIVLGNLNLLRKRLPEDPRMLRMVDGAIQGAERGASLTKRMLAFARRQQLRPEAVQVPASGGQHPRHAVALDRRHDRDRHRFPGRCADNARRPQSA